MNRNSLALEIAKKTKLNKRQAENIIIAFGAVVTEALMNGDKVIYSNFGSFYVIEYPSKTINHPKNGEKLIMLPTKVVKWMPSDNLKKDVAGKLYSNDNETDEIFNEKRHENETEDADKEEESNAVEIKINVNNTKSDQINLADNNSGNSSESFNKTKVIEQAHMEDNIELYHEHAVNSREKPVNIYEEILSDGGREFSTVQGPIRVHNDTNIIEEKKTNIATPTNPTETDNSKESEEIPIVHESNQTKQSPGPFETIKNRLGFFGQDKKDISDKSEISSTNLETPIDDSKITIAESQNNTRENKDHINLAESGIFGKNTAKAQKVVSPTIAPKQSALPPTIQPAEQKIESIKEELKENIEDNHNIGNPSFSTNLEPENTQVLSNSDSNLPIFSGGEGSFNFDKARTEYKDLSKTIVPKELLSKIPENIARSYKAVPFESDNDIVNVAMVDPEDVETREMIKRLLGEKIKIFLASESDVNNILNQYQGLESEVSNAIAIAQGQEENEENKKTAIVETVSDDAPAAKIVSSLLKRAIRDKASDIHIEPNEKEVEVRFRLDGMLRKKISLPKDIQAAVISRIKILSNMKIDEQRVPQDGRFNIHVDNRRVDFRVSSMPVAFGEKVVMRILDKESGILTIEQLGMSGSGLKTLDANLSKSHGMVLVTGPTGSGKSTSLYAMIQKVFNEGVNIITLEDPVEYQMKGINQSQVNSEIGYTFAAGLRSILRQDPDIIMLGEIRDRETAEMAVHAALTGHVVLSTLHTNDAAGAAPRMIDMGVEPFLITSSINVVVGQRLVRTICQNCKEEVKLPQEELDLIKKEIDRMPPAEKEEYSKKELKFYQGKGCKSCENSGYKGRIGIYEILAITPEMQQLILRRVSSEELNNLAINQGMVTMIQDGIIKAIKGTTSMKEVWRTTKN